MGWRRGRDQAALAELPHAGARLLARRRPLLHYRRPLLRARPRVRCRPSCGTCSSSPGRPASFRRAFLRGVTSALVRPRSEILILDQGNARKFAALPLQIAIVFPSKPHHLVVLSCGLRAQRRSRGGSGMSLYAGVGESSTHCRHRRPGAASAGHQAQRCARRFELAKIASAIQRAGAATGEFDARQAQRLADTSAACSPTVMYWSRRHRSGQDAVEQMLAGSGYFTTARAYIVRRDRHDRIATRGERSSTSRRPSTNTWRRRTGASTPTPTRVFAGRPHPQRLGQSRRQLLAAHVYAPEIGEAHRNADVHIHDLDMLAGYCAGSVAAGCCCTRAQRRPRQGGGRPAEHMGSAVGQIVNFLGTLQNEWAGAQAFSSFDTYMAPFIRKDAMTFPAVKQCIQELIYNLKRAVALGHADAVHEPDVRLGVSGRPARPDPGDRRAGVRSRTVISSPRWT